MRKNPAVRQRVQRNVRQLRKLRGLSREKLVVLGKQTERHLGRIERREVGMTIDYAAGLADALDVDVSELFRIRRVKPGQQIYVVGDPELQALEHGLTRISQSAQELLQVIKRVRSTRS